jgi:hypothetical protein
MLNIDAAQHGYIRFYRYRTFRTQLGPRSGAMGYGLPAASLAGVTGGILRKLVLLPHPGGGATRRLLRRTNTGFTYFRPFAEVTSWIARNV